ncbi:Parvulin peptidylprolyl isomerase [Candidatus Trichorickettsia mobilis]|uniref:Parvulin-like PPIase n=1 Tax=Candidatus Trichorickettsia mobilis TaxID=1346319 RepID=A0ABZ0UUI6_9RICK|nr:peptidylprolyl isomerase [Candidatus Trichorickettsia mobilis]WPY00653.1 Parvulin peptidylprolyl isomerase [Candidatus Trichorickettsia mobilis]
MKKLAIILLSASLTYNVAFAENDPIVATYKGGEVRESQIMQQFKPALDMQPGNKDKKFSEFDRNLQEALVRGYINVQLLNQEAKALGIETAKEFQEKLNNVKTQLLQQELIERQVKAVVTDAMIDAEYKKLVESLKGQEEIKVSHILVDSEEKAKEIKKKLSKGAKFSALVKEFSSDEGSKANNGEIGYITKGQLVPEFEAKAFSMKVKEISDPVKTQFGWHIIQVLDKRAAQVPTAETEKPNITSRLSREAVEKYFTDLASKADIKLNLPKSETTPEANKTAPVPATAEPTK